MTGQYGIMGRICSGQMNLMTTYQTRNVNKVALLYFVMIYKSFLLTFIFLSMWLMLAIPFSNVAFSQVASPITSNSSSMNNTSSSSVPAPANAIKKLESVSSFSNIVGMSMVKGIKMSGISFGDTDLSVTLRYQPTTNTPANVSLPVTVIVTKLPVANLTELLSLVGSTRSVALSQGNANPMGSLFGQTSSSPAIGNDAAIQVLSLLKNVQIGAASIVNGNWAAPQTVSMGLLGLGNMDSAAPNEFVTVIVVPYLGESSFPSVSLK